MIYYKNKDTKVQPSEALIPIWMTNANYQQKQVFRFTIADKIVCSGQLRKSNYPIHIKSHILINTQIYHNLISERQASKAVKPKSPGT